VVFLALVSAWKPVAQVEEAIEALNPAVQRAQAYSRTRDYVGDGPSGGSCQVVEVLQRGTTHATTSLQPQCLTHTTQKGNQSYW